MSDRLCINTDPPTAIKAGDRVLCPNGHLVAVCTKDMDLGDCADSWGNNFKFAIEPVAIGTPSEKCPCPECGANWLDA